MGKKQVGGNPVINVFLYIFGTIGVMALLYIIIVAVTNAIYNRRKKKLISSMSPPMDYMQQVGLNCPDYWIRTSNANGKVTCQNTYNLKQKNNSCPSVQTFKEIDASAWKPDPDDGSNPNIDLPGVKERCDWLRKCGGTWQGLKDICNN